MAIPFKNILVISPEYMGEVKVSKHHYAHYLSKYSTVVFLEPSKSWSFKNLFTREFALTKTSDNLYTLNFPQILPRVTKLPGFFQKINFQLLSRQLRSYLKRELNFNTDLVWSFDPHRFWDLSVFKPAKTVYHSVDFHPGAKHEIICCTTADLVVGISDLINKDLQKCNKPILKIGHGSDLDSFQRFGAVQLPGNNKIKAGYVGNLHKHISYDLMYQLVEGNPDVDFIIIGPHKKNNLSSSNLISEKDYNKLHSLKNLFFLGTVPSQDLMNYVASFDINLVLFDERFNSIHCNPHKLMGYFYAGGITLSTYIDEYREQPQELIWIERGLNELLGAFQTIKTNLEYYNSKELRALRRAYATEHSYENKIKAVIAALHPGQK